MEDRMVITRLERLRRPAPAAVLPAVLRDTGLADGYVRRASGAGGIFVAFNDEGISAVKLGDDPVAFEEEFEEEFGRPAVPAARLPARLARRLDKALATGRAAGVPFDFGGLTEFQRAVLRKTAEIPPGEVRPYGWIAREIGRPGAVRAVGSALNRNPIPVLIPCHRVVKSDGHVGQYAYGPAVKRALLAAEGLDPEYVESLADRGVRYTGTTSTHIYCLPTCGHAQRTKRENVVEFRSAGEAADAGYRPCMVCRPAAA